eukprot:1281842-Alexandrium_andersonii.AAC.1
MERVPLLLVSSCAGRRRVHVALVQPGLEGPAGLDGDDHVAVLDEQDPRPRGEDGLGVRDGLLHDLGAHELLGL